MYKRSDIIKNQKLFSYEIKQWFKRDFIKTKKELYDIESDDPIIVEAKKKLELKTENIIINKEINKFIINETNIYPKFYAWWNEDSENVEIYKYENR